MSALDGQRDERRAKIKESPEYQKSLKDAEKKILIPITKFPRKKERKRIAGRKTHIKMEFERFFSKIPIKNSFNHACFHG